MTREEAKKKCESCKRFKDWYTTCFRNFTHANGARWGNLNPEACRREIDDYVTACCYYGGKWDYYEPITPAYIISDTLV